MMNFLRSISKFKISVFVVLATIVGLYFYDPPRTECDIQIESIRGPLNSNFLRGTNDGGKFKNSIKNLMDFCIKSNSSGGCQKFFERMRYFEKILSSLPEDCSMNPAIDKFGVWYRRSLHLMVVLAWGEAGPRSDINSQKGGWLTVREQALYCRLLEQYEKLYSVDKRKELQSLIFKSIVKKEEVDPKIFREKSLLSLDCDLLRSSNR